MDSGLDAELDVWQAAGCAVRILYSRAVMERLRLAAFEGFNRLAHGGVEIGGVLFGVRDRDGVKVLAHRAVACEYAFGPSFTLSDNDRRALEDLLASTDSDSKLSGMRPVGWYHSHNRSEIQLSEKDLKLFQQYFPEIWQIALVLRPHGLDPVRAGFFFREPDGSVQAASSRHEFVIKTPGGIPEPPEPASQNSAPGSPPASIAGRSRSEPEARPSPAAMASNPPRAASGYPRRRWAFNAAVAAAAVAVVLAGVLFSVGRWGASPGLSLRAMDVGGQLRIDWNRNSRAIQQSQSGTLEIEDGSSRVYDELSQEHLRAGSITYLRTTGNVLVRLLVRGTDKTTLTEVSRFLAPPVATAAPIPVATAAPLVAGSPDWALKKDVSAKNERTDAGPVQLERERAAQHLEPAAQHLEPASKPPINPKPREASAKPAPARRPLVLPPASVPGFAEALLPAPPLMAANTAAATATTIPRLLAEGLLRTADPGPRTGKIIWTGKLAKGGTLQIEGNRASQGQITGGLPGAPVRVQVFPSELIHKGMRIFTAEPKLIGESEAPGSQNGWNRTDYVLNPKKAGEIGILEAPGQQNGWNRLVLRAERGGHSIIVLRWERVPAGPAPRAAGDP